jgi:lysozyme inhibitor LprI
MPTPRVKAEMNRQAAKDFEKADTDLNSTYAALMAKLPDAESKLKLKESQRAWIAFRDAEAAFAADQFRGGLLKSTFGGGCGSGLGPDFAPKFGVIFSVMLFHLPPFKILFSQSTCPPDFCQFKPRLFSC